MTAFQDQRRHFSPAQRGEREVEKALAIEDIGNSLEGKEEELLNKAMVR